MLMCSMSQSCFQVCVWMLSSLTFMLHCNMSTLFRRLCNYIGTLNKCDFLILLVCKLYRSHLQNEGTEGGAAHLCLRESGVDGCVRGFKSEKCNTVCKLVPCPIGEPIRWNRKQNEHRFMWQGPRSERRFMRRSSPYTQSCSSSGRARPRPPHLHRPSHPRLQPEVCLCVT